MRSATSGPSRSESSSTLGRRVALLLLLLLVVSGLTPAGVHLVLGLAQRSVGETGWDLVVTNVSGSLLRGTRLHEVRVEGHGSWVRADTVHISLWNWAVDVRQLRARWQVARTTTPEPSQTGLEARPLEDRLSILDQLPEFHIEGGLVDVVQDDSMRWRGHGLAMHWQPPGRQPGTLDLVTSGRFTTESGPLRVRLGLSAVPQDDVLRVNLQGLSVIRDTVGVEVLGAVVLGLGEALPVEADLDISSIAIRPKAPDAPADTTHPTLRFNGQANLSGDLRPLSVGVDGMYEGQSSRTGPFEGVVTAHIDAGAIHVDSFAARVADGRLTGFAELGFNGGASAQGILTDADVHVMQPPLGGRVNATIDYSRLPGGAPAIDVTVESSNLTGIASSEVDLRIQGSLQASKLAASAESQALGSIETEGIWADSIDLAIHGDLDAAAWLGREAPFSVAGTATGAGLSLQLQADTLPYGADLALLQADLFLHPDHQLDIHAQVAGQQLVAAATMDLTTASFDTLNLAAHGLDLSRWSPGLAGTAEGTWVGLGMVDRQISTEAGLRFDSLQLAGWKLLAPLLVRARSDGGRLDLSARSEGVDLSLWADADSVHMESTLAGLRLHRDVTSSQAEPLSDPTREQPETSGDAESSAGLAQTPGEQLTRRDSLFIRGRVRASAPWQRLNSPTVRLAIDSVAVFSNDLFARTLAPAVAHLDGDAFHVPRSEWATSFGPLSLSARRLSSDVSGEATWSVVGDIDSLRLEPWPHWHVDEGRVQVRVEGSLPYPRIEARVAVEDLILNEQPLGPLRGSVDLDEAASDVWLRLGEETSPELHVRLAAPIHLLAGAERQHHAARLVATAKNFEASPLAFGVTEDSTSLRVSGQIDVSLPMSQLAEGADWSHWRGETAMEEFRLVRPAGTLRLEETAVARLESGAFTIDGLSLSLEVDRLDSARARVVGSAKLAGVLDTMASDMRLRLRDIDLRSVVRLFAKDPGFGGLISGEAVFTGTLTRPALDVEAAAYLDELGLATMRIRGRPLGWNVLGKWRTPAQDELSVSIGIPPDPVGWPDWSGAKMRLRSSGLELAALLDQWGELDELAGRVQVNLSVTDFVDPKIQGQIDVAGLQLALLDMTPGYHFGAGKVRFSGDAQGHLTGFAGSSTEGSGRLELKGDLRFPRLHRPELSLHLLMDGVPYRYADIFHAQDVDADITWVQAPDGNQLSGFLRLKEPVAQMQLLDLTAPVPPPPTVRNELLERTTLDLFIDIDDLQSQSEISDVTVDGGIRLYGTLSKPRFQGEFDVTEGHLLLLSRRFDFDRGRIITDQLVPTYSILDIAYDPLLLDPELDLQATASVHDMGQEIDREVSFELRGTALQPAPLLTSAGLGDTEVLNLLAFGDPIGPSAGGEVLAVAAGQLLLSRQARKIGLDEFQLLSSGSVLGTTIGEPSLRVGKYIESPLSVWLRYEGVANKMSTGQLEAEYRITNLLKIDARTNSKAGVYGIGLVLEKDF